MATEPKFMLLTGASRGIGHATVKRFHTAGWDILTVSRQPFDTNCPWNQAERNHFQADLGDPDAVGALIDRVHARLPEGKLHALVNNAGVSPKGRHGARLGSLGSDYATWLSVFNVNLFSTAMLARGLHPALEAAKGAVVNVTSIVGSRVHPFAGTAYACSKAALAALTREQAHEFGPAGIRVNAIAPGEIDTSILSPGTEEIVRTLIPLHRVGEPREVAEAIFYLCSGQASYINGAEIYVNGGQHV